MVVHLSSGTWRGVLPGKMGGQESRYLLSSWAPFPPCKCFIDFWFTNRHILGHRLQSWIAPCSLHWCGLTDSQGCLFMQLSLLRTGGGFYHFSKILPWEHGVLDLSQFWNFIISFFLFSSFFFLTKRKPICNLVLQISVRIEVWSWKNQCNQHYLPVLFQEQENLLSNHWGGINATWYFVMYCNY